ncbi:MAG: hypothetical protein ACK5XP_07180 [Sphingobacteriia bacterium]|jgi:hypothetical protein
MRTLLLSALALRLALGLLYWAATPWEVVPLAGIHRPYAGTDGYLQLSRTVWEAGRWAYTPTGPAVHNRPPLPSLLMLLASWDAQHWYGWWLLLTTGLHVLGLWALCQAARTAGSTRRQIRWLGWAFALHPLLLAAVRASTFVPLATALLCLLIWAWVVYCKQPRRRGAVLLGLLCGLLALTHATLLVAAPLVALGLLPRWRASLCVLLLCTACLLPWTLRNAWVFHRFIPVATGAGIQYWKGESALYGPTDLEHRVYTQATGQPLHQVYYGTATLAEEDTLLALARADVRARPGHYLARTLHSYLLFWLPLYEPFWKWIAILCSVGPLWVLAVWRGMRAPRLFWALLLLVPLPFALLAALTGYYLMLLPLLLYLALGPRLGRAVGG